MATHWGNEGQVKIGVNTIAEILSFEFTETVTPVDDTSMGDAYKTHIANSGIKEWSGNFECHWDEADTTGQNALTVGASVTLNLYPEGSITGDIYWTGLATLTNRQQSQQMDGETIKVNFEFLGNGALTRGTVA
jgi:hypothetical protein